MQMSKEKIVKVLDEYGIISTFHPKPSETIIITIDSKKVDIEFGARWVKALSEIYPYNTILLKVDGMFLETFEKGEDNE